MENIDDFMRQKFDSDDPQERFEFQEEYWEQAQVLLEREENRRRRRVWLFILLVLAMALLAWFWVLPMGAGDLSENKVMEEHSTLLTEHTENQAYTNEKRSTSEPIINPSDSVSGPVEESIQREKDPEKLSQGIQHNRMGSKGMANPGNSDNPKVVASLSDEPTAKGRNSINPSAAQSARPNPLGKRERENPSSAVAAQRTDTSPITTSPITIPPITIPPITIPPATTSTITTSPITNPPLIPIFSIPTPLTIFPIPGRALVPLKPWIWVKAPIAEKIKPVQDQRFALGLSLAGTAHQASDTTGRWAGWAIGFWGKYRLDKNWSLRMGVQERFVPGHGAQAESTDPVQVLYLRYSFGYEREQWKRETRGLHYLEVPLSAQWHKGPWGLEAGGAAGKLLAVQNRTTNTTDSSLEAAKTTVKKFVKGDTEPYNQTYITAFVGAEYRLNDRISVFARGQYRFTPVLKTLGEDVKNNGMGNVELGLRARLF